MVPKPNSQHALQSKHSVFARQSANSFWTQVGGGKEVESATCPCASLSPFSLSSSLSSISLSLPLLLAFLQQLPSPGGQTGVPDQCCLPGYWHGSQVYWCWGRHSGCGWFRSRHWNSVWQLDQESNSSSCQHCVFADFHLAYKSYFIVLWCLCLPSSAFLCSVYSFLSRKLRKFQWALENSRASFSVELWA